jgi:hypothetical protein
METILNSLSSTPLSSVSLSSKEVKHKKPHITTHVPVVSSTEVIKETLVPVVEKKKEENLEQQEAIAREKRRRWLLGFGHG